MWLLLAFSSAAMLGFYDVFKKQALKTRSVVPVLTLNTLFSSLIFLPFVLLSLSGYITAESVFYVPVSSWNEQKYVFLKSLIVLSSWLCGYMAIKQLPLTLVGPINATRPVMVLLGALMVFGERLNVYQWVGVLFAIFGFWMLSRSGKKENIDFRHNRWVTFAVLSAALGAVSALYDKYLLAAPEADGMGLHRMVVQCYFNFYQCGMMLILLGLLHQRSSQESKAVALEDTEKEAKAGDVQHLGDTSRPASRTNRVRTFFGEGLLPIFLISLFLSMADFAYFYALSIPGALITVVSMIRRGSVLISFTVGALVFHEKNLRSKAIDLAFVLMSMVFLWLGSRA